ncbi:MAG: hypothetical protein QOF30_1739 [Acidimicrobiaceae bacterium]|nr:hypothetical protein [Acidimicrobiaceae bacterium]
MRRPLPPVDPELIHAFWQRCCAAGAAAPGSPPPPVVSAFGDYVDLADNLIDLVLNGTKRATAGAVADFDHDGESYPTVGSRWIATDGASCPRALLRSTDVRIGPLSSVDDSFAWDEGEGDRTRASWLEGHTSFFSRYLPTIGVDFHPDIEVVFERFVVDYQE